MVESKHSELADLNNEQLIGALHQATIGTSAEHSPSELREEIVNRNIAKPIPTLTFNFNF